jgi:PIN domain nuclease of toxin-antitoxin system
MKYLLDGLVWLWSIDSVERISKRALEVLSSGQEEIYFSAATIWELTIKAQLGKLTLPGPPSECIPAFVAKQGLKSLPVTQLHAVKVYELSPHHRDPFDRLLIAQAIVEQMTILTSDRAFAKYPVDVLWCGK